MSYLEKQIRKFIKSNGHRPALVAEARELLSSLNDGEDPLHVELDFIALEDESRE